MFKQLPLFIQQFKKSSYVLTNRDLRLNKPNVSICDLPNLEVKEGIDIEGAFINGNYCNDIYMGIIISDYYLNNWR